VTACFLHTYRPAKEPCAPVTGVVQASQSTTPTATHGVLHCARAYECTGRVTAKGEWSWTVHGERERYLQYSDCARARPMTWNAKLIKTPDASEVSLNWNAHEFGWPSRIRRTPARWRSSTHRPGVQVSRRLWLAGRWWQGAIRRVSSERQRSSVDEINKNVNVQ
jgi:hypothetical protein